MASDIVVIPVQPSPYDIWAADDVVKLIAEAMVYKENLKSCFVINRKIVNTAIGRDVADVLGSYDLAVLNSTIAQRVIFAESAAQGKAIFEVDKDSSAVGEVEAVVNELMSL